MLDNMVARDRAPVNIQSNQRVTNHAANPGHVIPHKPDQLPEFSELPNPGLAPGCFRTPALTLLVPRPAIAPARAPEQGDAGLPRDLITPSASGRAGGALSGHCAPDAYVPRLGDCKSLFEL